MRTVFDRAAENAKAFWEDFTPHNILDGQPQDMIDTIHGVGAGFLDLLCDLLNERGGEHIHITIHAARVDRLWFEFESRSENPAKDHAAIHHLWTDIRRHRDESDAITVKTSEIGLPIVSAERRTLFKTLESICRASDIPNSYYAKHLWPLLARLERLEMGPSPRMN